MNKKTLSQSLITIATAGSLFATIAIIPVSAQTINTTATANVNVNTSVTAKGKAKSLAVTIAQGDKEITARIADLNKVSARVQEMKNVSATVKAALATEVQTEISNLTTLKTKIDADTDVTVTRTDIKSITQSYRIYALVIPQGHITAASDRITTIAGLMTSLSAKLQTRLTAAAAAGKSVTTLQASLSDMNAKSADAKVHGDAALSGVVSLTPDNGDTAKAGANKAALKTAQIAIKAANQDFKAARADAAAIVKGLKAFHLTTTTSASATVSQ